jgi:membrane protease subunit (stomatin/prohibitin family)
MGIMSFLKKQFIDVIQWTEPRDGILAYRYPMQDQEIQSGAQLTVRDSQMALFVNEGQAADLFAPGLHTLTTRTLPILTNLKNWDKAFASPFKSDLYFFSTREQLDRKWGTAQPVTVRDKELGALRTLVKREDTDVFNPEDDRSEFIRKFPLLHGIKKLKFRYYRKDKETWVDEVRARREAQAAALQGRR